MIEKFGVGPDKVIEVQALIGDSSDNVPGVPGIGVKTAAQLIGEYGDLETLLKRANEIKQDKRRQTLIDNAEMARLSKRLVTLDQNVPLDVPVDELAVHEPDYKHLIAFLKAMEFNTITRRVAEKSGIDASQIEADAKLVVFTRSPSQLHGRADAGRRSGAGSGDRSHATPGSRPAVTPRSGGGSEAERRAHPDLARRRARRGRAQHQDRPQQIRMRAHACPPEALDRARARDRRGRGRHRNHQPRSDAGGAVRLLAGASRRTKPATCRSATRRTAAATGCSTPGSRPTRSRKKTRSTVLKPLLEDRSVLKVGQNMKYDWLVFAQRGIEIAGYDDTMLISYVLDAGKGGHGMDDLAKRWLDHDTIHFHDVAGSGKAQVTFDCVAIDKATEYAAEDADVTLRLWHALKPRLPAERVTTVYETLERADAGGAGAHGTARHLHRPPGAVAAVRRIRAEAGARSRTKSRRSPASRSIPARPSSSATSCSARWACPAAPRPRPANGRPARASSKTSPSRATRCRARSSTGGRSPSCARPTPRRCPTTSIPTTKRVHTTYALAATSTGRLSSSEPNLQNIPVRTEEGRKIRRAFVAAPGMKLVSADYSQIELRLLAEVADVPALRKAFQDGVDIHAMTASEMFGVPVKDMPSEVRRRAKAINFGIIYGISAFGLAAQLGIEREEAGAYIKKYFERFPGIRDYMDETREFCRANGYVLTLFGRKCHYPDIKASNPSIRSFNERAAINARLQGTAADIIRRAMIRIEPELAKAKLKAQMLLQVHDELIFEVPEDEVAKTMPIVKRVMEDAPHPAVSLHVPLQVDARAADNWDEAH